MADDLSDDSQDESEYRGISENTLRFIGGRDLGKLSILHFSLPFPDVLGTG